MTTTSFEHKLKVAQRQPEFAARLLRETAEEALVASVIGVLMERLPGATSRVVLEMAAIVRQHNA
jgi:hypothetical protein